MEVNHLLGQFQHEDMFHMAKHVIKNHQLQQLESITHIKVEMLTMKREL
jgi:hypothetical protein